MKNKLILLGVLCCFMQACVIEEIPFVDERTGTYSNSNKPSQGNDALTTGDVVNDGLPKMSEHQRRCLERKVTDYDGNNYHTVYIGNQCWTRENMRSSHSYDGKLLTCYAPGDDYSHIQQYGYLYDWKSATMVCPSGWHLPTDKEWTQMEQHVGGVEANRCDTSASSFAKSLCSTWGWARSTHKCAIGNDPSKNNSTGFEILPSGMYNSGYFGFGFYTNFWTDTELKSGFAIDHCFNCDKAKVSRYVDGKESGFSVRCVRN